MKANKAPETYPLQFRDKIDEYLWKEHHILGGCCSSIEEMKYSVAREVAEKLTDAFIEKARKWFEKRNEWHDINGIKHCDMESFEDFRKYMQEEPVSEKKCIFTNDSYTDEDRKVLCENCKEKCEYSKKEEHVSEDLGEYINELSKQFPEASFAKLSRIAVRVAKWQIEQIKEALLSEVLPCFMHGGEADEVVAKLEEVLNKKK